MIYDTMQRIWKESDGAFVFLPEMTKDGWIEYGASRPESPGLYTALAHRNKDADKYFTPLKFDGTKRRRSMVGRPGVIFADLDGNHDDWGDKEPSVLIESSPGHYHGYWFLFGTYDHHEWETHAKGWTQALGADPGGWDLTQVLRVPNTHNHKYNPPHYVRVVYETNSRYELEEFPVATIGRGATGTDFEPDIEKRNSYVQRAMAIKNLPLSLRYWLTITPDQLAALGSVDRSKILWMVIMTLTERHFTPQEVFQLAYFTPFNKHEDPAELTRQVRKAADLVNRALP